MFFDINKKCSSKFGSNKKFSSKYEVKRCPSVQEIEINIGDDSNEEEGQYFEIESELSDINKNQIANKLDK